MTRIDSSNLNVTRLKRAETEALFLPTGDIYTFSAGDIMLNLFRGDPLYGAAGNIWLRLKGEGASEHYPLIGRKSASTFHAGQERVEYQGLAGPVTYRLIFELASPETWFWTLELEGDGEAVDLVYGMDLGLASKGSVLNNELYGSQYIDYKAYRNALGLHLCARQNMSQGGRNPYAQFGLLQGAGITHYGTDGLEFFGRSYRFTGEPEGLQGDLPAKVQQGEFGFIGLQTETLTLHAGEQHTLVWYGLFQADKPDAVSEPMPLTELGPLYSELAGKREGTPVKELPGAPLKPGFGEPFNSEPAPAAWLNEIYPDRRLPEEAEGRLLSFFTPDHYHVALQEKELLVDRPHGAIITTFNPEDRVGTHLMTSTNYIYGLFHAQTALGNTGSNKLLSPNRGFLNQSKTMGLRLYVRLDGSYRLLQMPAAYETGAGHARWFYHLPAGDVLEVLAFSAPHQPELGLQFKSRNGVSYDVIAAMQLAVGDNEHAQPIELTIHEGGPYVDIRPSAPNHYYPELAFRLAMPGTEYSVGDDAIFYEDNETRISTFLTLAAEDTAEFQLLIAGSLEGEALPALDETRAAETFSEGYKEAFAGLLRGLELDASDVADEALAESVREMNETVPWFAHNALTHFSAPHGLEQPGGAAWGTRDVCQGPLEFFLAFGHYALAREILLNLYSHQSATTGEWPQWFMYDRYPYHAPDAHGDVVFWPLKALADYLHYTDDRSILDERLPYQADDGSLGKEASTVRDHVTRALDTIEDRFIADTFLISYAGGDWNDTLQPASDALRQQLISTWTQALAYQALSELGSSVGVTDDRLAARLIEMSANIASAFREYLIGDGVVSGMAQRLDDGTIKHLLHPADSLTGIRYRLIALTRSVIAGLVSPEQAERNLALVKEHLLYPDGAHLMDQPPRYHGGVSQLFQRAEQAAYIGRELSLMYTHAHIRYMEALARLDYGEEAWPRALEVNPLAVTRIVPNATRRQRNLYFSSSDGHFADRYEFQDHYDSLKRGEVQVTGGWRLYSSGPGIYLNQLLTRILGLHLREDSLSIEPSLPAALDGLKVRMNVFGKPLTFVYRLGHETLTVKNADGASIGQAGTRSYGKETVTLSRSEIPEAGSELTILL